MKMNMERIKAETKAKIEKLREELLDVCPENSSLKNNICIFACGSIGRLEMTCKSDLDLFFIIMNVDGIKESTQTNLDKYIFFTNVYNINKKLGYKEPTGHGIYWDFITQNNILDIGSREEDFNNSFTARLLLILESKPLFNDDAYNKLVDDVLDNRYFKDYPRHTENFYPLCLMNDILRYWYTLTLNYEYRRDDNDTENKKNWKRLKLKFARLITCFSMIACLYKKNISAVHVKQCIKMTPFERLDMLALDCNDVKVIVEEIKEKYGWFLMLRNENENWWSLGKNKEVAFRKAEDFHEIVVRKFMKIISATNPTLHKKTDMY